MNTNTNSKPSASTCAMDRPSNTALPSTAPFEQYVNEVLIPISKKVIAWFSPSVNTEQWYKVSNPLRQSLLYFSSCGLSFPLVATELVWPTVGVMNWDSWKTSIPLSLDVVDFIQTCWVHALMACVVSLRWLTRWGENSSSKLSMLQQPITR